MTHTDLNAEQAQLQQWLVARSTDLSALYWAATRIMLVDDFPAQQILVSHCVREMGNRLPGLVSGVTSKKRFRETKALSSLHGHWIACGLKTFVVHSATSDLDTNAPPVEIPASLYQMLGQVLNDYSQVRETNFDDALSLFMALSQDADRNKERLKPLVKEWRNLVDWFVKRVHVREGSGAGAATERSEFSRQFRKFENTLQGLVGTFFEGVNVLDEILEETNH